MPDSANAHNVAVMAKHSAIPVLLVSAAMLIATPVAVAFADPLDSSDGSRVPKYTELVPDRLTTSPETNLYYTPAAGTRLISRTDPKKRSKTQ